MEISEALRTLGLTCVCSPEDRRRAHRRLARALHPDAAGDTSAESVRRFDRVRAAYLCLTSPAAAARLDGIGRLALGAGELGLPEQVDEAGALWALDLVTGDRLLRVGVVARVDRDHLLALVADEVPPPSTRPPRVLRLVSLEGATWPIALRAVVASTDAARHGPVTTGARAPSRRHRSWDVATVPP